MNDVKFSLLDHMNSAIRAYQRMFSSIERIGKIPNIEYPKYVGVLEGKLLFRKDIEKFGIDFSNVCKLASQK